MSSSVSATVDPEVSDVGCWQTQFEELLPAIRSQIRFALRHLYGEAKVEAQQEILCTACATFARLHQQGRTDVASATSLVRFAVKQYRVGRRVATRTNVRDVMTPACRLRKHVRVESLTRRDSPSGGWSEVLVEDARMTPADLAATRIDYPAFLATLGSRRRQIAETLATGETTLHTARLFGLSTGRVSQLRQELKAAWDRFIGNLPLEHAVA